MISIRELNKIEIIPSADDDAESTHCIMFYEYNNDVTADWLETAESFFTLFKLSPAKANGHVGKKKSSGSYFRIKEKLKNFLILSSEDYELDIRIDSKHIYKDEKFFPCKMRYSRQKIHLRQGVIAVRSSSSDSLDNFISVIAEPLFNSIGISYAHAFDFPACYGPDYYLASVGTVLSRDSLSKNENYKKRLTNWRDNIWHKKKKPSQGFFREIYPINFLLQAHLDRDFQGRPLEDYMKKVGTLERCDFNPEVFRWDVSEDVIDSVRQALEPSGLVLSAPKIYTS